MLDLLYVVEDAGGRARKQEHMGELGVNCEYVAVAHLQKEARDLFEGDG